MFSLIFLIGTIVLGIVHSPFWFIGTPVFLFIAIYRYRVNRFKNLPALWLKLYTDCCNRIPEFHRFLPADAVDELLVYYSIDFRKFFSNYEVITGSQFAILQENKTEVFPTTSMNNFMKVTNRPVGIPEWFLCAFPDVVMWINTLSDTAKDNFLESVFENSNSDINEFNADIPTLKKIAAKYREIRQIPFECSLRP